MTILGSAAAVIFVVYFTYANARFFNMHWFRALFASILHIIIGYIGFSLFSGIIGFIVAIIFKLLQG